MTWEPRGKDRNAEDTELGVSMGRTWLITSSAAHGVRLWRVSGNTKQMEGRFANSDEAKVYADGLEA